MKKTLKYLFIAAVLLGLSGMSSGVLAQVSVPGNQPSVQQPVKKAVTVPKPKTNWSKLKELFM